MENLNHCQSCGMPMMKEEDFGKNYDGSKSEEFCCHCYPNGAFLNPHETVEEMIEVCVPYLTEEGEFAGNEAGARAMLTEFMPSLKRWKKTGMVITFKLKEGVSPEEFLAVSDEFQEKYLSKYKGFICRQLMVINGVWTDWIIYETRGAAEGSMAESMENECAKRLISLIGETLEHKFYPLERSH